MKSKFQDGFKMLVKDLIKELEKYNTDAIVAIENDSVYTDGVYEMTDVDSYEDGIVYVTSDHEKLIEEY